MSNNSLSPAETLALRRKALLVQCTMQRLMLKAEVRTLVAPMAPSQGWRALLPRLKLPLAVGGVLLGLIAAKPSRAVPIVQIGATLLAVFKTVLPLLRREHAEQGTGDPENGD